MTAKHHGNPTICLPPTSTNGPRILTLAQSDNKTVVWRSLGLSAIEEVVRVDVWQGQFLGPLAGSSLLPPGKYQVGLVEPDGTHISLHSVSVGRHTNFDVAFSDKAAFPPPGDAWHADGTWVSTPQGIQPTNTMACLFTEGDMHGSLQGTFELLPTVQPDCSWGLIARHYNAFSHARLQLTLSDQAIVVRLLRYKNQPPDLSSAHLVAENTVATTANTTHKLCWSFNGTANEVTIDGHVVLRAQDGLTGGVTVVGLFAEPKTVSWQRFSMTSSQAVARFHIATNQYKAMIRPGNIQSLKLLRSAAPEQDIFWESGLQFGHIGGSEIKCTQGANLDMVCQGDLLTRIRWAGPMPKFLEQSHDVRGMSWGSADFYPEHIVVDDRVLAWVRRSVGPDLDMLGRLMAGPARVAMGSETSFRDWTLPTDGSMAFLTPTEPGSTFPILWVAPLQLDDEIWWLKSLIILRYPDPAEVPCAAFAWQCPRGLTASHDFRVCPNAPTREYAYTIVLTWQHAPDVSAVERDLLNLRDDWTNPMALEVMTGAKVSYQPDCEQPREALDFSDCFDRAHGCYVVAAENSQLDLRADPLTIERRSLTLLLRNWSRSQPPQCILDDIPLQAGKDLQIQQIGPDQWYLHIARPIAGPIRLRCC